MDSKVKTEYATIKITLIIGAVGLPLMWIGVVFLVQGSGNGLLALLGAWLMICIAAMVSALVFGVVFKAVKRIAEMK